MKLKNIAIVLLSVLSLASVSNANPTAALTRARTAVTTANATTTRAFSGLEVGVLSALAGSSVAVRSLENIAQNMESIAESNEDVVNGMSKVQRVQYLADMFALVAKANNDDVSNLVQGKPLTAITAPDTQVEEEALDSANIEKFHQIITRALDADEVNAQALEEASQAVTGHSFAQIVEACGSADAVSAR